jgi:hypothetical protein
MASLRPGDPAHLLVRFTEAVDQRRHDEIAACFTESGQFRPGARAVTGRKEIGDFYRARLADPGRKTRHSWSNVVVHEEDAATARITALLTNYAFEPVVSDAAVQVRIGNVDCRLERGGDGIWRFTEHLYESAFALSLPLSPA